MINARPSRYALAVALVVLLGATADGFAKKDKWADVPDEEIYQRAMAQLDKNKHFKARSMLEKLVKRGDLPPDLAPLVQVALADTYFGNKGVLNLTEAMSRYSNFLIFYPTHAKADYAQYRLALCHFMQVYAPDRDQSETFVALEEFRKVQRQHPDSPYVDLAMEKILEGSNVLAEHEYRVGAFYYNRNAYLGAIDRFLNILDKYPRYPEKDRLYYFLGDALTRTARSEEGQIYLRKLLETYPKSKFSPKASLLLREVGAGN